MTHSFWAVLSHRDTLTSTVLPACCPEYGPHQPSRSSRNSQVLDTESPQALDAEDITATVVLQGPHR